MRYAIIEKEGAIFLQYGEKSHHRFPIDDKLKPEFEDQLEYWFRSHLEGGAKYGPGIKISHTASEIRCDLTDITHFEIPLEKEEVIVVAIKNFCPTATIVEKATLTIQQNALVFGKPITPDTEAPSELNAFKNG